MKLKLVYANSADIPEGFEALYEERDGKWHFGAIDGLKTEADTKKLSTALDAERKLRKDAEAKAKKLEKLGDRDLDEVLKTLDEVDELRAKLEAGGAGDDKAKAETNQKLIDAAVRTATGPLTRQIATLQTELAKEKGEKEAEATKAGKLKGKILQSALQTELSKAAAAGKVVGTAVPDVLMHAGVFDVEHEESEAGEIKILSIKTKDGVGVTPGLDAQGWLGEMKAARPHWWEASQGGGAKGGSGGGAGGGDNPFNPKAPNMTAASKIMMSDPGKAMSLAKAAGFSSPEEALAAAAKADAAAMR